jgi:hypothetical protein
MLNATLRFERDIALDRHPGKQPMVLEHDAGRVRGAIERPAADAYGARGGSLEAGEQLQQGRRVDLIGRRLLAAAGVNARNRAPPLFRIRGKRRPK